MELEKLAEILDRRGLTYQHDVFQNSVGTPVLAATIKMDGYIQGTLLSDEFHSEEEVEERLKLLGPVPPFSGFSSEEEARSFWKFFTSSC